MKKGCVALMCGPGGFEGHEARGGEGKKLLGEKRERFEMDAGVKRLEEIIKALKADGRKPRGFLSARTYIPEKPRQRVVEIFERYGMEWVGIN